MPHLQNLLQAFLTPSCYQTIPLPEIAFLGRSNVGKSSLINSLCNNKKIAKVAATPGRTQSLNFFQLGEELMLVDMPGYGYAKAPTSISKNWQPLIKMYLMGRPNLKRLFLLIDIRRGITKKDHDIMTELDECAISYQIVVTKSDKIADKTSLDLQKKISQEVKNKFIAAFPEVLMVSAHKNLGIDNLKAFINLAIKN